MRPVEANLSSRLSSGPASMSRLAYDCRCICAARLRTDRRPGYYKSIAVHQKHSFSHMDLHDDSSISKILNVHSQMYLREHGGNSWVLADFGSALLSAKPVRNRFQMQQTHMTAAPASCARQPPHAERSARIHSSRTQERSARSHSNIRAEPQPKRRPTQTRSRTQ